MAMSKNPQNKMGFKQDFYSRKWLMQFSLKKGFFFTIDSIIGAGIVLAVIIFTSSTYVKDTPNFHLNYMSQDMVKTLSAVTVGELGNEYLDTLIADGTIENINNTVLEQIGEFWSDEQLDFANKTAAKVTAPFVPNTTGMGVWIDNDLIYKKDLPIEKSLVTSKMPISGVKKGEASAPYTRQNPPILWGPAIAEVRVWQ